MSGIILLAGGAEFGGRMAEPDRRAIELAGGPGARISIIPAAAAPDRNHERASANGVRWFRSLGAQNVAALPLIDRDSAERPEVVAALRESRLIYLLGGFTHYLGQTLLGSASWHAILEAYAAGAVVAGSSAGAMVLCEHYYDPRAGRVVDGLNLVPNVCVLPHHDTFGRRWAPRLGELLPSSVLTGIDERTGMLDDGDGGRWRVYGQGSVTLYREGQELVYREGERFRLE
ncbi:MAG TPA: Type 1 glutamine amidotransferase-like domain-containing protein [Roseiflexaceae bacterium]|nr:Type 1 glutamine amidotransferase-like domain-containing protein [Roseiflexaceae bacterium]